MKTQRCYKCMRKKSVSRICRFCGDDAGIPNPSYQLAAGSCLNNRYMAGRATGQGGFGITYTGWDIQDNVQVAVKEYFLYGIATRDSGISPAVSCVDLEACNRFAEEKERFLREYRVLSELSGIPGLVHVRDCFSENNTVYIVMDYVEGVTLRQYVAKQGGKLSAKETFGILEPVATSLKRVHDAGLIHRDVSPDNLMVLKDGSTRLLDFGTVREVNTYAEGKPAAPTEALIKRGYAPLEQYQSTGSLGPWTDVYALCATACFCLTGKEPPEAVERLLQDKPVLLRDAGAGISEYEEGVLQKGMALRICDRIPDMQRLYDELFNIQQIDNLYKKSTARKNQGVLLRWKYWWFFLLLITLSVVVTFSHRCNTRADGNKVIVVPLYFEENTGKDFEVNTWVNIKGTVAAYSDTYTLSCSIYLPKQAFKKEPLYVWIHSRLDIGGGDYNGGTMDILFNLRVICERDELFLVPDGGQDYVRKIIKDYYQMHDVGDYYKVEIKDLPYQKEVHFGDGDEVLAPVDTSRGGELALNINLSAGGQKLSSAAYLDDIILKDNSNEVYSFDGSWESLYEYQYFCECFRADGSEEIVDTPEIGQIYLKGE